MSMKLGLKNGFSISINPTGNPMFMVSANPGSTMDYAQER